MLIIRGHYKHNKTIYCKCDNTKTEKKRSDGQGVHDHQEVDYVGKVGIVKIVLNEGKKKNNKRPPKGIDFTETNEFEETDDFVPNGNDRILDAKENDIIHFKFKPNQEPTIEGCENIINMKYGFLQKYVLSLRFPTVFLSTEQCSITIKTVTGTPPTGQTMKIVMKFQKTESIDGCDFTKPTGEGDYQHGFPLVDIQSKEKICSIHIKSRSNSSSSHSGDKGEGSKIAAGIKCPYKLTPTYCFRHVLHEKNMKGVKDYQPFLMTDVLGTTDVEFYSNVKEGSYIIGLPTGIQKYSMVRCLCEYNGKTGIMELKIDSSSRWTFLSRTLMLLSLLMVLL
ncbi:6-cysteine protein [Plasmodium knowlesi strain H]|uniref:6-cysteine protein n=3 Tax=Plasmodium knowlesi TaxID=5850 RepID=A0A5K1U074_PLAKH|nr:6-cysteine protein [Plasmodium knowlesi strain H]OTN63981.1 6-cysteine protein [Plasmodium knowlesi]CAA9990875.1 6-cysteine protein [Plasmodium knowlesi strain H]SBO20901.1 6-cysteine protein [Plasmodium knowlesi strain H]SBO21380.1 6-cysteine protein [Plasmodium knowlesi strain H]VVS80349.1 6-cysteine protein [Plasmodium knowlesi strain H]|eukprot:XP_002262162.1 pf47, putative [Plasmodium knowlesi strain H]